MEKFSIKVDKIQSVVYELIDESEDIYGFISEKLPLLEDRANNAIDKSKKLLENFNESENLKYGSNTFIDLIKELDREMKIVYKELLEQKEVSKLLDSLTTEKDDSLNFSTLLGIIDDLDNVIQQLEELSINAIIFSSKLEEGDAFRVLSHEINELAMNVDSKYDVFQKSIINLKKWNLDFINELEDINETEEEIIDKYNKELSKLMENIIGSLKSIAMLLEGFMNEIQNSLSPIHEIINLLQSQDLIRQNMENLNEIINTLSESIIKYNEDDLTKEEKMNTISFILDISQLSKNLMTNIEKQFQNSIEEILEKSIEMDNLLSVIKNEGNTLWDYMVNGINEGDKKQASIDRLHTDIISKIDFLLKKIKQIIKEYKNIDNYDKTLKENLNSVSENFRVINKNAARFKKINVLAKIEFARLDMADQSHIKNIDKIITQFIDFTNKNETALINIEENLVEEIEEFREIRKKTNKDLDKATDVICNTRDELKYIKDEIKNSISDLTYITKDLSEDVHHIITEFENFSDMTDTVSSVEEILNKTYNEAEQIKSTLLEKYEIDNWEITNDYYSEVEKQFTSYIERKTAQETFDQSDIDAGSEGGELTLF